MTENAFEQKIKQCEQDITSSMNTAYRPLANVARADDGTVSQQEQIVIGKELEPALAKGRESDACKGLNLEGGINCNFNDVSMECTVSLVPKGGGKGF